MPDFYRFRPRFMVVGLTDPNGSDVLWVAEDVMHFQMTGITMDGIEGITIDVEATILVNPSEHDPTGKAHSLIWQRQKFAGAEWEIDPPRRELPPG